MTHHITIGTRGSALALYQANLVKNALEKIDPDLEVGLKVIKTSGDWTPAQGDTRLSTAEGGKGLFAREIELALLNGEIDCGVHSMKDMASFMPEGLVIDHMLPREDPADAFVSFQHDSLSSLPQGATVGTASLRRQAGLLAVRPDLHIVPFRGNVPTRLDKLRGGQVDATLLAVAGLKRLGLEQHITEVLSDEVLLPAAGQGAVGIQIKQDDTLLHDILNSISCPQTVNRVKAERAALQVLDGSCHTPIGAIAVYKDKKTLSLHVKVLSPDGKESYEEYQEMPVKKPAQAIELGRSVGSVLKERLPEGFLEYLITDDTQGESFDEQG